MKRPNDHWFWSHLSHTSCRPVASSQCRGGKRINFLSDLLSYSGWINNHIDMRQISRKNDQIYLVCTYKGPIWTWDPGTDLELRLICPLELRRSMGVWFGTSKGKKAIHREIQKQKLGKQRFAGRSLTMGHREIFGQMGPCWLLPVNHKRLTLHYSYLWW